MPRKALETGAADFEMRPTEIGRALCGIAHSNAPKSGSAPTSAESGEPKTANFPIVGIGASAGGLEAFTALLEHLPARTGMGFVLLQHLDPTHASQLTEILARTSAMPVQEARDGMAVEADHVYVMPPGKNLTLAGGSIIRFLALSRACTICLSTYSCSIGERSPKSGVRSHPLRHGFGRYVGCPSDQSGRRNHFRAGAELGKIRRHAAQRDCFRRNRFCPASGWHCQPIGNTLPPSLRAGGPGKGAERVPSEVQDLDRIFVRLRAATGIDFTNYKQNTILRRINRRMALHGVETLKAYSRLVDQKAGEAAILAQDFLVNVTSFFREPEVHERLKEIVFPALLEGRSPDDPIRVWVPGCSTGEEAYSLAIALTEFLEERTVRPEIQIFASDLNEALIDKARAGVFLENALGGVSPARLERFFVKRSRVYQVSQAIRDLCVFARHDVTRDPPFSKMDLVSCCNLLIYLGPVLQKKALAFLHYALKPHGFLVLGSSESIGTFADLFETVDRKCKIFSRKPNSARQSLDLLSGTGTPGASASARLTGEGYTPPGAVQKEAERMLLAEYAPASVIVDENMQILQARGQLDSYLQVPQGAPTASLTLMVRPGLLAGLKMAIQQAQKQNAAVGEKGLRIKEDGHFRMVDVRVSPIRSTNGKGRWFLVLFEDSKVPAKKPAKRVKAAKKGRDTDKVAEQLQQDVGRLEHELTETRDYLQSIIETQEASAEELRSSMEEAQATNEELDTAREEFRLLTKN